MTLGVLGKQFSGGIQMSVFPDTGKNIDHFASVRLRVLNAVSGKKREPKMRRQIDERCVRLVFTANEMSLKFDENIFSTKGIDQELRVIGGIPESTPVSGVGWKARPLLHPRYGGVSPKRSFRSP
jgi:hypothetical protein